jgi:PITH domain
MKGGDVQSLIKITERFTEITAAGGGAWQGSSLPRGYTNITDQIDMQGVDLLNADSSFGAARSLFSDEKPTASKGSSGGGKGKAPEQSSKADADWVESDTDAQLMLYIPFQGTVKIHSVQITSFAPRTPDDDDDMPARPRRVELYINRSHNLGFEEADDIPATQTVELSADAWNAQTKTAVIETRFVKFQHVSSLVIFVVDADGEGERTRIDRVVIVGEPGEKRTGKLQKIGDDD